MNRIKKHRIKEEKATTSSSSRRQEEHDLAYFIHDRVELMHQVFSVLKSKELKSLAPECVRRLSIDDLQELCLEELLGISSKRLCAILDGAEPPSDTDSSSQSAEQLETISLDSISSDDEVLSQASGKKKKHKHRHSKKKRRKKSKSGDEAGETRASRAGLTVLELLELQARARAIRAQLHQEPAKVAEPTAEPASSDNDEVLIKEEPAEVVEISSSDDEKPDVKRLDQQIGATTSQSNEPETNNKHKDSTTVTKRINDLVITVPQTKPTRKIRLKRQKPTETATKEETLNKVAEKPVIEAINTANSNVTVTTEPEKASNVEVKNKSKKNKKKKKKVKEKEGSDEDEITIQLSDTEKMDLLEDLDVKNFDTVSSSDSDSSDENESQDENKKQNDDGKESAKEKSKADNIENNKEIAVAEIEIAVEPERKEEGIKNEEIRGYESKDIEGTVEINDLPVVTDEITKSNDNKDESIDSKVDDKQNADNCTVNNDDEKVKNSSEETTSTSNEKSGHNEKSDDCVLNEKSDDKTENSSCLGTKSDGEISDRESSEVEASDVQPEVVCISDDEGKKKKKKKKDKKSKKEKKKSVFREESDENFYNDKKQVEAENIPATVIETIEDDDDDVYEYLEISDDSSCYEVEGVSVLSKEPTAEEIEAFSARMDEIDLDRDETVITIPSQNLQTENDTNDLENVSWKDRYLGSKKVKRVLTTSNILNAIRKKNRELKKKLEEAKKAEQVEKEAEKQKEENATTVEEGTIEQYETLIGSTKYVDPVKEVDTTEEAKEGEQNKEDIETKEAESENVTREMKKDAKQLLKMYKRLLKYNDVNKQKDPNKKKKKKQKKSKDKEKEKVA